MTGSEKNEAGAPRCTLCPAACQLELVRSAPDAWRIEYPLTESAGLCPRGSTLGELLHHPHRIVTAAHRSESGVEKLSVQSAMQQILPRVSENGVIFLVDGNLPCEELVAAAAWTSALPNAKLCLVIEPADEQLLLGIESSGAEYLSCEQLGECDGFVIVGDAFAANPICSRGILEKRQSDPKTPLVVIDPAAGTACKFATHKVQVGPCMELAALGVLGSAAGLKLKEANLPDPSEMPSAADAGKAIANCKRLAIIVAAEYGRTTEWRQIGNLAGQLAKSKGGAVAPQTAGANALAAVRLTAQLNTISLTEAMREAPQVRIALGTDVLGMLGWGDDASGSPILAAAAALPNCTTQVSEFVLPTALGCELSGTYLLEGDTPVSVSQLLPPPAGVPSPAELIAALAAEAGISPPKIPDKFTAPKRVNAKAPAAAADIKDPPPPTLLLAREAIHEGCGALTRWGSWQRRIGEPEVRISVSCAKRMNLKNLAPVSVSVNGRSLSARVRIAPELSPGIVVLPEGLAASRALVESKIDGEGDRIVCEPVTVDVSG